MAEDNAAVGWQTSPSRRGTLTIIENSLFTMFACTWSIQHLNVPALGENFRKTLPRKCKWAVFTVFFPEFLMALAILEFVMAVGDMELLEQNGRLKFPSWYQYSRQALRYPGRIFRNSRDEESAVGCKSETNGVNHEQQDPEWTLTHCYFANMGGFYLREKASSSPEATSSSKARIRLLTARHFADSWESIEIPKFSEADLNDKSKTDYFTKTIAVIQIAQLLLSLIVRTVRHLSFSQLETLTLAFAIFGVLTYICYWYKPQDVKRPLEVQLRNGEDLPSSFQQQAFDRLWQVLADSNTKDDSVDRIRNDNIPKAAPQATHYALYMLTVLTVVFGSIHAIAWNFEFPTLVEQILWRTATLVSTAVPPLALLTIPLSQILRPWGDSRDFMRTCLDVMREYSWDAADKEPVRNAMKSLEKAYDSIEDDRTHYRDVFNDAVPNGSSQSLGRLLLDFINKNGDFEDSNPPKLPDDFRQKFTQLVNILDGNFKSENRNNGAGTKKLRDEAWTNVYPQRVLFARSVNLTIVYVTGIMYCLARLSIIGVAFSSLRQMPDSVYTTTWATNIPSLQ